MADPAAAKGRKKKTLKDKLRTALRLVSGLIVRRRFLIFLERPLIRLSPAELERLGQGKTRPYRISSPAELKPCMLPASPAAAKLFRRRIQDASLFYYPLMGDGKLHGYVWVAHEDFFDPALGTTIPVAEHEAYFFDGFVPSGLREGFKGLEGISWVQDDTASFGKTVSTALCDVTSRRSMLYHYSANYKESMRCLEILKIFGRVVSTRQGGYTTPYLCRSRLRGKK